MKKKIKNKKAVKIIISIVVIGIFVFGIYVFSIMRPYMFIPKVKDSQLQELNIDKYNKLMIVAHPDDEVMWGGEHLINDEYLVVCITRGNDEVRKKEFENVLTNTNDAGLILSYPDKIAGKRSKWLFFKNKIEKDIVKIISYKHWDEIVTHNEDGEYGHQHHKMTHSIVAKACDETDTDSVQMYFGTYYKKKALPDDLNRINQDTLQKKEQLVQLYKSQKKTIKKLEHMLPYETWIQR